MNGDKVIHIALVGNPNSGKSSIFNALTGARQHVGNYPGVTVDTKEGDVEYKGYTFHIVDLPGIYSLTSYSPEEVIARRFIIERKPAFVVNVIDASNLERNLYLTIQLFEMGVPVVIALNMIDEVREQGIVLDVPMMSKLMECPVVETVGIKGMGIDTLKDTLLSAYLGGFTPPEVMYRDELGREIEKIVRCMPDKDRLPYSPNFAAIKLLENDTEVLARFKRMENSGELLAQVQRSAERLESLYGYPPEVIVGDRRYGFASGLVKEITLTRPKVDRISLTEKIDAVVTSRFLGFPLFLGVMYIIFWMTFTLGSPLMNGIDAGFSWLSRFAELHWPGGHHLSKSLFVDGVLGGVGGVITFLPNIILLFLGISFLEDTGYMARIAFIMDKIMHKIGLHGRSFIPLIIGFGCTVPAIMATRTIRSRKTKLATIMILPLMSCGARLTIYMLIIPAFFPPEWQAEVLWSIYLVGVFFAMVIVKILRKTVFKGEAEPFVMELPPYRLPGWRSVLTHMWDKSWMYLKKAGTVILGISILLWALSTFPRKSVSAQGSLSPSEMAQQRKEALDYSFAGRIGHAIEPALRPMGFDWKIGTAFIGAFAAKEVFVAQMGIVYSISMDTEKGTSTLRETLRSIYSPLVGYCIMLFALIASPCMATFAVTRKETGSWKWAFVQWAGLTVLGWILATSVYQLGRLFLH